MGRLIRALLTLAVIWIAGYAVFRALNTEVWAKDKRAYVIYPATGIGRTLYTIWRPLAYVDHTVLGRGSHIGPHR